ncbi:MAG: hypothetical protein JWP11_2674 [Frankiales bacterium]|nr:hypothetical protein [Frankiales bacterium]
MSEQLRTVLTDAAYDAAVGEPVPHVAAVHARASAQRTLSRRRSGRLAPVLAALLVLAVAVGATFLLRPLAHRGEVATIPPPPKLGPVVPPLVVRQRLGAPPGHLNGPAVSTADLLAISPTTHDGGVLRTVGVVRPHATPDAKGRPRLDRCLYTYSHPGELVLAGRCDWATSSTPEPASRPLTLLVSGPPGSTWISGTAPAGTAAVLLRSPGRADVAVPTADPGTAWQHRPYFVAWWPRKGTDVVAVNRKGHELARTRLPSDVLIHRRSADPQLGVVESPLDAWFGLSFGRQPRKPPALSDVLARTRLSSTVTLMTLGFVAADGEACILDYVQDYSGGAPAGGGAMSCGMRTGPGP